MAILWLNWLGHVSKLHLGPVNNESKNGGSTSVTREGWWRVGEQGLELEQLLSAGGGAAGVGAPRRRGEEVKAGVRAAGWCWGFRRRAPTAGDGGLAEGGGSPGRGGRGGPGSGAEVWPFLKGTRWVPLALPCSRARSVYGCLRHLCRNRQVRVCAC